MSQKIKKIVLAYSGGLDTSVILQWLLSKYDCEIITVTADLGQHEDFYHIEEKALKTGASKAYVENLCETFVTDYIFPMLRTGALYEGRYLLGTAIARPLITKLLIDIARREGAEAIAHGATGKGNDQIRFELSAAALAPDIHVIAPWREWNLLSRTALHAFAKQHNIPIPTSNRRYSKDENMLHCSFEGSELEDPWEEPQAGSYTMTIPIEDTPDIPEYITITFNKGNPVAINEQELSPAELLTKLNVLGKQHGIGRIDMVESRFLGIKSRGVYETPGGTIIHIAHKDLEGITLDHMTMVIRDQLIPAYADAVYNGFWFSPEREAIQAFMDKAQECVSGTVRLKLYKGTVYPVGRKSLNSLYNPRLASFEEDTLYNHNDATGFIHLKSLRIRGYKNC